MLETLREILLIKAGAASLLEPIGEEELAALESFAAKISKVRLLALTDLFNRAVEELREATIPQLPLELAIVEATLGKQGEEGKEGVEGVKDIGVKAEDAGEVRTANAETRNKTGKTENKKPAALPRRQEETETQKGNETQNFRASEPFRDSLVARETFGKGAAKAKTQKDENKLLKKLQKDWTEFLKKLKPLNSSIALFLKDAKPIELDEDLLTIEFGYRFHKEKVGERKYREVVEKALEGFTGTPLRIKGVVSEKPTAEKKKETIGSKSEEEIDPAQIFGKLE
jgi:DNA polymerase III gamma/tau subunit